MTDACWNNADPVGRAGTTLTLLALSVPALVVEGADDPPTELRPWLAEQQWRRDAKGPIVSLGESGEFDDTHIFAPLVARDKDRYLLWYCGSTGRVAERVFHLGHAVSDDGREFKKRRAPVFSFPGGKRSILTTRPVRSV